MFTPKELAHERGWPGRIEGETVIQLAAQTLQSFFTGGGSAREHAVYPLEDVLLRSPVLHPPSVRVFDEPPRFRFENPAAIFGPDDEVPWPEGADTVVCRTRPAAIVGNGVVAGFTVAADWRAPGLDPPKDTDFALSLGPALVTLDEYSPAGWEELAAHAARNTELRPGDVLVLPVFAEREVAPGETISLQVDGLGVLRAQRSLRASTPAASAPSPKR